jgi:hypothetical protein
MVWSRPFQRNPRPASAAALAERQRARAESHDRWLEHLAQHLAVEFSLPRDLARDRVQRLAVSAKPGFVAGCRDRLAALARFG